MDYITTFKSEGRDYTIRIASMKTIAAQIGSGTDTELRVWRVLPNQEPQPLWIHIERKSRTVWLTDRYGYEIDTARYGTEDEEDDFDSGYTPSSTAGDYSPGNPWDAPGMSISDFI